MNRILRVLIAATLFVGAMAMPLRATVSTTSTAVGYASWTSLGTGPLQIQATDNPVYIQIADLTPPAGAAGFFLRPEYGPIQINTGSTVWALSTPTYVTSTVITAPSLGFNGGAATQGTSPWIEIQSSQYPNGATPVTASATGTTASTTATLPAASSKKTYVCGFSMTATATTGLDGAATLTGTVSGTLNFLEDVGAAPLVGELHETFSPCLPSSAVNTGIAAISAAPGTGGVIAVTLWGYQL